MCSQAKSDTTEESESDLMRACCGNWCLTMQEYYFLELLKSILVQFKEYVQCTVCAFMYRMATHGSILPKIVVKLEQISGCHSKYAMVMCTYIYI